MGIMHFTFTAMFPCWCRSTLDQECFLTLTSFYRCGICRGGASLSPPCHPPLHQGWKACALWKALGHECCRSQDNGPGSSGKKGLPHGGKRQKCCGDNVNQFCETSFTVWSVLHSDTLPNRAWRCDTSSESANPLRSVTMWVIQTHANATLQNANHTWYIVQYILYFAPTDKICTHPVFVSAISCFVMKLLLWVQLKFCPQLIFTKD